MIEYKHRVFYVYFSVSVRVAVDNIFYRLVSIVPEDVSRKIDRISRVGPVFNFAFTEVKKSAVKENMVLDLIEVGRFCSDGVIKEVVVKLEAHSEFGSDNGIEEVVDIRRRIINIHLSCRPGNEHFKRISGDVRILICSSQLGTVYNDRCVVGAFCGRLGERIFLVRNEPYVRFNVYRY